VEVRSGTCEEASGEEEEEVEEVEEEVGEGDPSEVRALASSRRKSMMRPVSLRLSHSRKSSSTLILAEGRSDRDRERGRERGDMLREVVSMITHYSTRVIE
jgi:hypothetical protein